MIKRTQWHAWIQAVLERGRILTLVGSRQCGKTTLAREFVAEDSVNYFDLEDPGSLTRLDESVLRVLVDRSPLPDSYLYWHLNDG